MTKDDKLQGALYMVATPIGNLEDITLRALRILKEVDWIAAEDTRHSRILLNKFEIITPLISLHEHNEKEKSAMIISKIESGLSVAYISDAGTPCISDPGYHLVNLALEKNIRVIPIPGPSALIAGLSVCGFPADSFLFCGFLPPKKNSRRQFLESIKPEQRTLVFYESPSRIEPFLNDALDVLGDRPVTLAREITKMYEEIVRGSVSSLLSRMAQIKTRKGEFTVVVQGASREAVFLSDDEIFARLQKLWASGPLSLRDAVDAVVCETGESRKKVYNIAVKMRSA